jgi:Tol biopolymer transport system component
LLLTGCAEEVTGGKDDTPEGVRLILESTYPGAVDKPAWIGNDMIIFSWNQEEGPEQLWTIKLDGSNPVKFIADGAHRYLHPRYCPELNMVAYEVIAVGGFGGSNVWAAKVNGSVAGSTKKQYSNEAEVGSAQYPCWGPDGHSLGYLTVSYADGPGFEAIELDDNDPPRTLDGTFEYLFGKGFGASRPAWYAPSSEEPFSGKVAFDRIPPAAQGGTDIYYYDLDAETLVRVTSDATSDASNNRDACWSPDGRHIVYSSDHRTATNPDSDFRRELYVVSIASKTAVRLTVTGDNESQPAWSPDGAKIAYVSDGDLYVKDLDPAFLPQ